MEIERGSLKILPAIINIAGKPVVSVALTQISNCYDNIFTSTLNTCQTNIVLCGGGHGAGYYYRSFRDNLSADIEKNRFVCPNELLQKLQLILQAVDSNNNDNCLRERIPDLIRKASIKNNVLSMNFSGYGDYDSVGVNRERNNQLIHKFADTSTNFINGDLNILMPSACEDIDRLRTISRNLSRLFSNNNLPNGMDRDSLNSINHNLINPTDFLITNYMQSLFTAVMLTYLSADQNIRYRIFSNINKLVADSLNAEKSLIKIKKKNLFNILIDRIFDGIKFLRTPDYKRIEDLTVCICNNVLGQADHVTQIDFIVLDKTERTIADGFIDNEGHFFVPYSSILGNSELAQGMQPILNDLVKLEQKATSKKINISLENINNDFTEENLIQACRAILAPGEVITCPDFSNPQFIETLVRENKISSLPKEQMQKINFKNITDVNIISNIIRNSKSKLSEYQIITIFEGQNITLINDILSNSYYRNYLPEDLINDFGSNILNNAGESILSINFFLDIDRYYDWLVIDKLNLRNLSENQTNNLLKNYWDKLSDEQFANLNFGLINLENLMLKNISEARFNVIRNNSSTIIRSLIRYDYDFNARRSNNKIIEQKISHIEWLLENNYISNENIAWFNSQNVYCNEKLIKLFTQEELANARLEDLQYMIKCQFEQADISNWDFSTFDPNDFAIKNIIMKLSNLQIQQLNLSNIYILKVIIENENEDIRRRLVNELSDEQIKQIDLSDIEVLKTIIENSDEITKRKLVDGLSNEQINRIDLSNIEVLKTIIENSDENTRRKLVDGLSNEQINQIDKNNNDILIIIFSCNEYDLIKKLLGELSTEMIQQIGTENNNYILRMINDCNDTEEIKILINKLSQNKFQQIEFSQITTEEKIEVMIQEKMNDLSKEQILCILKNTNINLIQYLIAAQNNSDILIRNFDEECYKNLNLNNLSYDEFDWLIKYHADKLSDEQIHQIDTSTIFIKVAAKYKNIVSKFTEEQIQRIDFSQILAILDSNSENNWIPIEHEQILNIDFYEFYFNRDREWVFNLVINVISNSNNNLSENQVLYLIRLYEVMKGYLSENRDDLMERGCYESVFYKNDDLLEYLLVSYSKYFPLDVIQRINVQDLYRDRGTYTNFIGLVKTNYDKFSEEQKEQVNLSIIFNYLRVFYPHVFDASSNAFLEISLAILCWQNCQFDDLKTKMRYFKFSYGEIGFIKELLISCDAFESYLQDRYLNNKTILLTSLKNFFCDFKGDGFFKSLYNGEKNDELNEPNVPIIPNILKQIVCLKARDCYGFEKGMKIVRKLRSYFSKLPQDYKNELNQINEIDLMDEKIMMKKGSGFIKQICQGNANYLMQGRKCELFGSEFYLNSKFLEGGEKNELIKENLLEILNQKILSYSLEKQTKILQHFKDNVQNIHPEILSYLSTKFNVEFPQNEITHDAQNINLIH